MKTRLFSICMSLFVAAGSWCWGADAANEVVARVNGQPVIRRDLDITVEGLLIRMKMEGREAPTKSRAEMEREMLEDVIDRELVAQVARTNHFMGLDAKVSNRVSQVRSASGGSQNFVRLLKESKMTEKEYANRVREDLMIAETMEGIFKRASSVSTNEIQAYYEENREKFFEPEAIRISHIVIEVPAGAGDQVKTEKRARIDAVASLAKEGKDFAELAQTYSDDNNSKNNGGDLGFLPRGGMLPEFEAATLSLASNQVTGVIVSRFGYHVLKNTGTRPRRQLTLDEIRAPIEQELQRKKNEATVKEFVASLRAAAKIEILLPPLPSATNAPAATTPKP